jgi:acetolactate synthase-1/2/3 large subunit
LEFTKATPLLPPVSGSIKCGLHNIIACDQPYHLITSGGMGTMGFGLPSAIGAWFAHKDKEVWVIDGDGSFQ